uniref:UL16-binding protein 1-like n=1 Tax=Myodes glareolus TaxID=447135 RepID=UPI00202175FF|nr:UL16-binding protein 1-like [Myodes glareolus]
MAKAAVTGRNRSLILCLFVLLSRLGSSVQPYADSLCYGITIGKSGSGSWWHNAQCQLNEETFLSCNTNNNCHPVGALGNRLNATQFCEKQVNILKDGADLFKKVALHVNLKTPAIRDLQVKMCCWYEVDGHFNGSWDFYLKMLHADSKTGEWTKVDPGSSCMKEMLEENKYVPSFLKMTSQGDCRSCLKELKLHWGEKLEPTALTTAVPDVVQPSSMAIKHNISVLLVILMCLLLNLL